MQRKLIPLTDDITSSESFSKLRIWQTNQKISAQTQHGESDKKIEALLSKWNGTMKMDDEKLDTFRTVKKAPKDLAADHSESPEENPDGEVVNGGQRSLSEKSRKTIAEQKTLAKQRAREAAERRQSWKSPELNNLQSVAEYDRSLHNGEDKRKPRAASRSVSFLLPNLTTRDVPEMGNVISDTETTNDETNCEKLNFDPREKQQEFEGNRIKVYQCGEKLFAKIDGDEQADKTKSGKQRKCSPNINLNNSQLNVFAPRRNQQNSVTVLTLGKPYGIQLGTFNIGSGRLPKELREKQSLDILLVAHGVSFIKAPDRWSTLDIDNILLLGTELCKATSEVKIDKLGELTKGFTHNDRFVQVTMSEPVVVGKVMTLTDRSMDLQTGLQKFFAQHKFGILQTPNLNLYIAKDKIFFVFDPRGRTTGAVRSSKGDAALMAFHCIENVYHLILNLSEINIKGPFKICTVSVTQMMSSANSPDKFTAVSGNPRRVCRNNEFKTIDDQIAYVRGSLHLGSKVFDRCGNKQQLTTSIMAMVYSKIDPPNSWSSSSVDRVLHFGTKLYFDCLEGEPIRNLTLMDIPSKFYVGDAYRVGITIVPFLKRVELKPKRLFCDSPITKELRNILENSSFRCLILQIGNFMCATWQMRSTDVFYFFDGYQKDADGNLDRDKGSASLFMLATFEKWCEHVVNRLMMVQRSEKATLDIHGMKIVELTKLSQVEMKCKPKLRVARIDCFKPLTADDADKFRDSPSTVDSVAPILTAKQILKIREEVLQTEPSKSSLRTSTVEQKLSSMQPNFPKETIDLVLDIHSEIFRKAIIGESPDVEASVSDGAEQIGCERSDCADNSCGQFIGYAEKVLLKTDLSCLEQEREEVIKSLQEPSETLKEASLPSLIDEPSHFKKLPDGTEIVYGTKKMFELPLEPRIYDFNNLSVLVGISAIVTATKYSIESWTPETVDYVIACGHIMSGLIQLRQKTDFYTIGEHHLPNIHINNKFYSLQMFAVADGTWCKLEQCLSKLFKSSDRFVIVTFSGSFAVFTRKNFFYMFEYATCNLVGFRINNSGFGASCFLRFTDVQSMARRIHLNHSDIRDSQRFLVYRVTVDKLSEGEAAQADYVPFTDSQENNIVEQLRQNRMMCRDQRIEKLKAVDAKIRSEKERIKNYREATGQMTPEEIGDDETNSISNKSSEASEVAK